MEEYGEVNENGNKLESGVSAGTNRWLAIAAVLLLGIAGVAFGYGYRQQVMVGHLTAEQTVNNATISQLQGQVSVLTGKLNDMVAAQAAAAQSAANAQAQNGNQGAGKTAVAARTGAHRGTVTDKRYKKLEAQLQQQQKDLKATQDEVAKNRSDLEGNLNSTRDELNGSIATTHEELVALEKRGERSYFEFDLSKAKQFQRVGPISLSLRKADSKHKNYDLAMIVDDNQLSKKRINLYEPIWIHSENASQPVQIVVNRIEKNVVHGYVSAPKYKPSELAATGNASVMPVATQTQPAGQIPPAPNQP